MTETIDRPALRALAEAAAAAKWRAHVTSSSATTWDRIAGMRFVEGATPRVVLALLDALEEAERALTNARDLLAGANVEDPGAEYALPVRVLAMVELCRQQRDAARAGLRLYGACLHPVPPFAGCASRLGKACDCGLPEALERAEGR